MDNDETRPVDYNDVTKTEAQRAFDSGRAADVAAKATEGYAVDRPQVAKVRYSHDAMVDLLIQNPGISQGALAAHFGYTQSWVCTIMASDAFQVRLASRRHELIDPEIAATIEERYKALATVSVNKLIEHMNRPMVEIDPEVLLKAAALGAKAVGIGGHAPPPAQRDADERLNELAGKLTGLLSHKRTEGAIDVEVKEINEGPRSEAGPSGEAVG